MDSDLVRAAQSGDIGALGSLLARHRPGMTAVAISVLGPGPDADDAVQEAMTVALARIGDVREPGAVGGWLRQVVRNACLTQLRARRPLPLDEQLHAVLPSSEPDPAQALDRHATREWVWRALEELSAPLRLVVMLRHFSGVTAYQDIADACGIPVGTVRSRLAKARGQLSASLLATADTSYGDVGALTGVRWREVSETMDAAERGTLAETLTAFWTPDARYSWSGGSGDVSSFLRGMYEDIADGVRGRLTNVLASQDVTVSEIDLINPPEDPLHCPPTVVWVQHLRGGRVHDLRLFHSPRIGEAISA
ncbi:sigma-70 family RNA polymerase sigma factor [Kribbella sandramycini]|uniref:RNA polymerase sigma-70 factor (ECF subfamily) n=1 Tax=Kribbella sandramycini TaxID=60450 RepID=A0A7Y4KUK5_9ACTN|nr:sigma-70 family RNA polymerase sigma factor [Kribbella sandramycini]MBB6568600.1 RNA polymerase sigma-70 factor (ECF subfamily) [Kribbella sandramycini]NOL38815.1 sigma-70 family RNA polymerase sigma factor [Kribbella sandramycini]